MTRNSLRRLCDRVAKLTQPEVQGKPFRVVWMHGGKYYVGGTTSSKCQEITDSEVENTAFKTLVVRFVNSESCI